MTCTTATRVRGTAGWAWQSVCLAAECSTSSAGGLWVSGAGFWWVCLLGFDRVDDGCSLLHAGVFAVDCWWHMGLQHPTMTLWQLISSDLSYDRLGTAAHS